MNSDIIIYDVKNDRVLTDSRFCGSDDWETFPAFSPGGKYLYMCVAHLGINEQQREMMQSYFEKMKYALIRVPFNSANGTLGEKIDTIYSPSQNGGSVSFPRISPRRKISDVYQSRLRNVPDTTCGSRFEND